MFEVRTEVASVRLAFSCFYIAPSMVVSVALDTKLELMSSPIELLLWGIIWLSCWWFMGCKCV